MRKGSERRRLDGSVAVVTGGNRGLGRETCRQLRELGARVWLGSRSFDAGAAAAEEFGATPLELDITDPSSVERAVARLRDEAKRIDIWVNNAAVLLSGFDADVAERTVSVNFTGTMRVTDAVVPLLARDARLVMVSSGLGALSCLSPTRQEDFDLVLSRERLVALMEDFVRDVTWGEHQEKGWPTSAYGVSKVGVNALTRILARELPDQKVNAVCPGWVRTDMGGSAATRSVQEGARGIVWAATLGSDGPTGGFFRDSQPIPF